jgi:hypothetical protein
MVRACLPFFLLQLRGLEETELPPGVNSSRLSAASVSEIYIARLTPSLPNHINLSDKAAKMK